MPSTRTSSLLRSAIVGAGCGLAGAAAMTVSEKLEQAMTGRPNSYVPARTLQTLLGRHPSDAQQSTGWNHAMHWGTGAAIGALRGMWAATGIRGSWANATHTVMRLGFDQTLENTSGVGAPPTSWPAREVAADVLHKAVYAVVTGVVADRLIRPTIESRRGITSH